MPYTLSARQATTKPAAATGIIIQQRVLVATSISSNTKSKRKFLFYDEVGGKPPQVSLDQHEHSSWVNPAKALTTFAKPCPSQRQHVQGFLGQRPGVAASFAATKFGP